MTRHYCKLKHEFANGAKASEMHHVLPVPGSRSFQTGPWRAFCFDQHPAKPLRGSNGLGPCPQIQMQLCSMAQCISMQTSFCTADLSLKTGAASMCAWCTWLPWCRHLTTSQKWMNGLQVSNRSHCFFLTRLLVTIPSSYLVTSCQSRSSHRTRHLRQAAGGSASSSSALALSLGSLFKARRTTWEDQTWSNSDLNRSNKKEQERGLDGCWEQFYLISDGQVWPSCIAYLFSTLCWQRRRLRIDNLHNQCCHIWRSKWLH